MAKRNRAKPLTPEGRRAALITATLPLVLEFGPDLSTRQIARAAGVAEGTIFRVFSSKDELIRAAVESAFDAAPTVAELTRIGAGEPLRERLVKAVEILKQRFARVFRLMDADLRSALKLESNTSQGTAMQRVRVLTALTALIESDTIQLRCEASEVARRLWLLSLAGSNSRLTGEQPLSPVEIVDTLLDGLLTPTSPHRLNGQC